MGVEWTIIGHSERRSLYGEDDALVATKLKRAQELGLNSIVCIGEHLDTRNENLTNQLLATQLLAFKASVTNWDTVVIAYEPVWAIGTGVTATPA